MKKKNKIYLGKMVLVLGCIVVIIAFGYQYRYYRTTLQNKKEFQDWSEQIEAQIEQLQAEEYRKAVQKFWNLMEQILNREHQKNTGALYLTIGIIAFLAYSGGVHLQKNKKLRDLQQKQDKEEEDRIEWKNKIQKAIEGEEFVIYYQPKVDVKTEKMVGAEALIRWKTKEKMIFPNEFIPILEKYGLIDIVDRYVFTKVCQEQARWKQKYQDNIVLSVNASKEHLTDKMVEEYCQITEEYGIKRKYIELEITETATVSNEEDVKRILDKMKEAGFILSIDDFGTGYSSLSMLQDMPIDVIKIDKTFIQKADINKEQKNIIEYIIFIAKHLKMKTVAEGVETAEQVKFLKKIGCDMIQGYYYAKPMNKEEFEKYFLQQKYKNY